jgi:hypothetical protein
VLLIEVDGPEAGIDRQAEQIRSLCEAGGSMRVSMAKDADERAKLWMARKKSIGTIGRLAPSCATQDGVAPRTKLPEILRQIGEIAQKYNLRIANVFHAGDGNLHPCVLFDERDPDEVKRVLAAGGDILRACVAAGGSLTGEHGIGIEKQEFLGSCSAPTTWTPCSRSAPCSTPTACSTPANCSRPAATAAPTCPEPTTKPSPPSPTPKRGQLLFDAMSIQSTATEPVTLLLGNGGPALQERVRALSPNVRIVTPQQVKEQPELLAEVTMAYGGLGRDQIGQATNLRWLQTAGQASTV